MSNYNLTSLTEGDNKILTVKRGVLCLRAEERWAEIKDIADRGNVGELRDFVLNLKDSGNYSGVPFTNTFRVSRPISLVSLGFFGPHKREEAFYNVSIQVEDFRMGLVLARHDEYNVKALQGKVFNVAFPQPVNIMANVYYNLRFQLDGPDTGICDPNTIKRECNVLNGSSNYFEFFTGSLQMPEISFINSC